MLKNNQNLQDILDKHKAPYIERAEEIKKLFPVEEAPERLQELQQMMADDPNIKGIVDLVVDEMMHEGIAATSIDADGAIVFLSKADIFK